MLGKKVVTQGEREEERRGERRAVVEFNQSVAIILLNHASEFTFIRHCNKNHQPLLKYFTVFKNCGTLVDICIKCTQN